MKTRVLILFFLSVSMLAAGGADALPRLGIFGEKSPEIKVESFKWRSGGLGRRALFSEVTLTNKGVDDYVSVTLKARFSNDGRPAGSTRGKIKQTLKAGETKTFRNVRLGVMNAGADSVKLTVAGARKAKSGGKTPLSVTSVEWRTGGQGMGVGTVRSVTVKNSSPHPYGSVKFLLVQKAGGKKVFSNRLTAKKIAAPQTETVYENLNPGFMHPSADEVEVRVASARRVSPKQAALIKGENGKERKKERRGKSAARTPAAAEDYEPVPGYDIRVKHFEWGSGIAGSAGIIRRLVLENTSPVRYKEATMTVEFLSPKGIPLISNSFKIKNPPEPGKTAVYKNLTIGIISVSPAKNSVKIRVKGAKPADAGN